MNMLGKIIFEHEIIFGLLGVFSIFSPLLLWGVYLIYNAIKKFIFRNRKQYLKQERSQILFYNLWLPLKISNIIFWGTFIPSFLIPSFRIPFFGSLSYVGTGFGFWIFYAFYHLFYKIRTKHTKGKYYGGKVSWIVFVASCIIFIMSFVGLAVILSVL